MTTSTGMFVQGAVVDVLAVVTVVPFVQLPLESTVTIVAEKSYAQLPGLEALSLEPDCVITINDVSLTG